MELSAQQLYQLHGAPVYAQDGDKIGDFEALFVDPASEQPGWIGVGSGFLGTKRVLVPAASAVAEGDGLRVPYDKEHVKDGPDYDSEEISPEAEQELLRYYGMQQPAGPAAEDASVTRSEEELRVGTEQVSRGTARLRKWVETQPVEMQVALQQETARVTREPIEQPVQGAEIGEQEIEVELRGERPVVEKQVVAKERVGLERDVQTEATSIADEVRREHVEVDDDRS
jgi:stress response protein YsnF